MKKILASACLVGEKCRYDGSHRLDPKLGELHCRGKVIAVCPEFLGGLPVPRPPAEIQNGDGYDVMAGLARVKDFLGNDVTAEFCRGAILTLELAMKHRPDLIVLKDKSPSCGSKSIYDGTFTSKTRSGVGVTTALLEKHGFKVENEKSYKWE